MVRFTTTILRFTQKGEKSGWTYIEIPAAIAQQLKPGNKRSFRVKGFLDAHPVSALSLLPMGEGNFILPLNASLRKILKKTAGFTLAVQFEVDVKTVDPPAYLMECLSDEPAALAFFNKLPASHRNYFVKWIETAKTDFTKTRRLSETVSALSRGLGFAAMLRLKRDAREPY